MMTVMRPDDDEARDDSRTRLMPWPGMIDDDGDEYGECSVSSLSCNVMSTGTVVGVSH